MDTSSAVLVLTGHDDPTADAVIRELDRRGARTIRLDTGDFPSQLHICAISNGTGWAGRLWTDDHEVALADIRAVYYRRPTRFRLPSGLSDGDALFATTEARLGLGGVLASLDARWVNSPFRVAVAEYKPLQLRTAIRVGLKTPRTLVTNDPAAATNFADGRPAVCKTLSSLVLSEGGEARIVYTTPIAPVDIDSAQLAATAHLLQEWVPKARDARVTMVGNQPIAVAITAGTDQGRADWRADYANLRYELIDTPPEIADNMIRYLREFDLSYGAFDFVITPDDEWIMLECNPAGQWLWLEHETGAPIAASFAELLMDESDS